MEEACQPIYMLHIFDIMQDGDRYWQLCKNSKGIYNNVTNILFDGKMEENVTCTRGHTKTQIQEYKYANTQMFVDAWLRRV